MVEEIALNEIAPKYENADVVPTNHPSPAHDAHVNLKPVPSNRGAIKSKYATLPLPGVTESPYSTVYDHVSWWQISLRSRMNLQ